MKPIACLLWTLLLASSLGIALPGLAEEATTVPPSKSTDAPKTDLRKNAATGPKKPAKVEEEAKIPGLTIPRAKGGYLGLLVEDGHFKLSFYDSKKKPVPPDVARAAARWPVHYKTTEERAVLNPGPDGLSLISNKFVRPPYLFKLYLTLLTESEEAPEGQATSAESYPGIDFQQ